MYDYKDHSDVLVSVGDARRDMGYDDADDETHVELQIPVFSYENQNSVVSLFLPDLNMVTAQNNCFEFSYLSGFCTILPD